MFARISTYKTGPDTRRDNPADDVVNSVLQLPGCKGVYYLNGKGTDNALSITLWDTEESMLASNVGRGTLHAAVKVLVHP